MEIIDLTVHELQEKLKSKEITIEELKKKKEMYKLLLLL